MTRQREYKRLLRADVMALMYGLTQEIKNIQAQAQQSQLCLALLSSRFERILQLMTNKTYVTHWPFLSQDAVVIKQTLSLRDQAVLALAAFEKHQARRPDKAHLHAHGYFEALTTTLSQEVSLGVINKETKLLFIGSGAMPSTALYLAKVIGAHVCCHDIDEEAQYIAKGWIKRQGMSHKISLILTNEALNSQLQQASHIIIASLVPEKVKLLNQFHPFCKVGTKVFVRHGDGIKSLFNYPFPHSALRNHWPLLNRLANQPLYDVDIIVRTT